MTTEAMVVAGDGGGRELMLPSPVFQGAQMVKALSDYRDLQRALDQSMPDQIMQIQGKTFRKKGYWRAIRVAFNLTVTCERETREVLGTLDNGGENYVYSVTYRAASSSGVSVTGDGTCAAAEKQRGRLAATEHNVRSHAHTRAFNRAVSNLVGFGEVSAEEVERDDRGHTVAHETGEVIDAEPSEAPTGAVMVRAVEEKHGTTKAGKPWTSYAITLADGRSGSTFDKAMAERARAAILKRVPVETTWEQKGQFLNITGLEAVSTDAPREAVDPEGRINAEGVAKFWQIAKAHGWTEKDVMDLLAERQIPATSEITVGAYGAILNALKAGPPAPKA